MVKKRVLTAVVLIPVVIAVVWFGGPAYSLTVAVVAVLGALEFWGMRRLPWNHPETLFGIIWILLLIMCAHLAVQYTFLALASAVIFSLVWLIFRSTTSEASHNWAWTLAGILYIGWMLSYLIPLRGIQGGRDWVFFALFTTFAIDTASYFVGSAWGKHLLAPGISPGKTWEGTTGGLVAGVAASLILAALLPAIAVSWQVGLLGLLVGIFAQLGDLGESVLKRGAGVKDASNLLPGHGGLLDRLDSLIFAVVVVYYYVLWVVV